MYFVVGVLTSPTPKLFFSVNPWKPDSNQPAHLYGTAKTHKFETLEDITVANLTFQPIIDQTGIQCSKNYIRLFKAFM